MKCPKCGSDNVQRIVKHVILGSFKVTECLDCGCDVYAYQQRLGKVLSKFDRPNSNKYRGYEFIVYDVTTKIFHISAYELNDLIISLDTVESLIKDLEDK